MNCCAGQLKLGASVCASLCASICASLCVHQLVHQDRIVGPAQMPEQQHTRTKIPVAPPPSTNNKSFDTWTFQEIALRSFCAPRNLCAFQSFDFLSIRCWLQAGAFVYAELRSRSSLQTINRGKGHVWMFGQRGRCDLISSTGRQFLIMRS